MKYISFIKPIHGDDYFVHQSLKAAFDRGKILYQRTRYGIYVISDVMPAEKLGADKVLELHKVLSGLNDNNNHLFSVRLNPVVTRFIRNKKRRVCISKYKINEWVAEKLNDAGMDTHFTIQLEDDRVSDKKGNKITLSSVMVVGTFRIAHMDKFRTALTSGIGHGKGLGFGALNISANQMFV